MFFASDNSSGVHDEIMEAIQRANRGPAMSYGADDLTRRVEARFAEIFETDVDVLLLITGTAANALSIAGVTPPYGAVFCHGEAHIMVDECGASEFYTGGAKLIGIEGGNGRIAPQALRDTLAGFDPDNAHLPRPAALSLTQASEVGTLYRAEEIAALSEIAREHAMAVHMDGARFANALVALDVAPGDITWRAGVDILSFGATKNGAMGAEAIVVFSRARKDDLVYRRMRAGHQFSKSRFVAAQFDAYFTDDLWLKSARHANAMAALLGAGAGGVDGVRLGWPVEANEVFLVVPKTCYEALGKGGAVCHPWPGPGPAGEGAVGDDEILIRLVASFATTKADVDHFLAALRQAMTG